jgi:hypothetical protein
MPDIIDPAERLDALLSAAEPRIANIFRASIAQLKDKLDLNEIADLLQSGMWETALEQLQEAAHATANAATLTFITSGQSTRSF